MKKSMRHQSPKTVAVFFLTAAILIGGLSGCSGKAPEAKAPRPEKAAVKLLPEAGVRLSNDPGKTEIFRNAGLGLFIHWGPNSQMGTEISWPLYNASEDYIKKYYALAETFNPAAFDPAAWARLARLAGMEYVVFTAKHHDGFCMFDTDLSDFKITRTPYGRDIAAMVADAFRKEGFLVGFYYSPGDFRYQWETGERTGHIYEPNFESPALFGPLRKNFVDYERGQIEELLTRYGDIFMLWFDGKCEPLKKHSWRVRQDVFIGRGEIPTPEQEIPGLAADHAWESCLTTSYQWSFLPGAEVRSSPEIIDNLIHIRARGGNMLLNIGPRPDGRIAPADEDRLRDLGLWMMLYGESVRGVRPWIVTNEGDVWFTRRRSDGTVYALTGLERNVRKLLVRSVMASPETRVTLLSQDGDCKWEQTAAGLMIEVRRKQTVRLIRAPAGPGVKTDDPDKQPLTWGPDWPVAVKITNAKPAEGFERYGMVIGIKPEKIEYYKALHAAAWPSVLAKIKECGIRNYSINLKEVEKGRFYLFSYFEYTGDDFQADMARMAADPTTQRWWKETDPCQVPIPTRGDKEFWSRMEEVFHLD